MMVEFTVCSTRIPSYRSQLSGRDWVAGLTPCFSCCRGRTEGGQRTAQNRNFRKQAHRDCFQGCCRSCNAFLH